MLRTMKILLVVTVASWGFVGALHNVIDWGETTGAVGAATSMATFDQGPASWQATNNLLVVWLGALFIVLSKIAAGVLCAVGAFKMWQTRDGDVDAFANAKTFALSGCAIAIILLFGGFVVIADSWFELWRSDTLRAPVLDSAFRYGGMIALIAIFVGQTND